MRGVTWARPTLSIDPMPMVSPLWPAIEAHRREVLPPGAEGLRDAIVRPAEQVGVFIEQSLDQLERDLFALLEQMVVNNLIEVEE